MNSWVGCVPAAGIELRPADSQPATLTAQPRGGLYIYIYILGFLRRETVFGLNKIYLGLETFGFYPRYLVSVNDKVIAQSVEAFKTLNCVKFISARNAGLVSEDGLTHHIQTSAPKKRFSHDITEGVHEGWTVT